MSLSENARREYFLAVIQPCLEYCAVVTCTQLSCRDRERLLALYRRGIRAICRAPWDADIVPLMSRLKLVKLQVRWLMKLLVFGYRCLSTPPIAANCLAQLFSSSGTHYQTRGQSTSAVRLPWRSTKCGRNALDNRVSILWNNLPPELRCCTSTVSFKYRLKKLLSSDPSACQHLINLAFCPASEL